MRYQETKKEKIDKAILDINNYKEYDQTQSLYVYQSKQEINEKLYRSNLNSFYLLFLIQLVELVGQLII